MNSIDASLLIWLNSLSGHIKILDDLMRLIASDYLMPLVFSLSMFWLWFSGKTPSQRMTYQLTALTVNRKFGLWLVMAASLYGFSRVYVGVFYPTDIVGGALVGMAVYGFTSYLRRALEPLITMVVRFARCFSVA